nr:unnamed protein product [Digitaria exilis]
MAGIREPPPLSPWQGSASPPAPSPWLQAKQEVAAEQAEELVAEYAEELVARKKAGGSRFDSSSWERAPRLEFMGNELEFGGSSKAFVMSWPARSSRS